MTSQHDDLVLVANAADSTISAFALTDAAPEGHAEPIARLTHLATSPVGMGCSTFVIDEVRDLVHAGAKPTDGQDRPGIDTFTLDRESGHLSPLSGTARRTTDGSPTYLDLTPDGTILAAACYHQGTAHTWRRDDDGRLGEAVAEVAWPNAHCAVATDRNLYVVSLGADVIAQYALALDGQLAPLDPPTTSAPRGSGPRHLTLDADQSHAYVITEFSGDVLTFHRDPATGALTAAGEQPAYARDRGLAHSRMGADPRAEHLRWGADVHLARAGRFLLASERCESTLASLPVGPDGRPGALTHLMETPRQPRGFAVSTDGRYAVVAGEESTHLALVEISDDGSLRTVQEIETGSGANWVRCIRRHG